MNRQLCPGSSPGEIKVTATIVLVHDVEVKGNPDVKYLNPFMRSWCSGNTSSFQVDITSSSLVERSKQLRISIAWPNAVDFESMIIRSNRISSAKLRCDVEAAG